MLVDVPHRDSHLQSRGIENCMLRTESKFRRLRGTGWPQTRRGSSLGQWLSRAAVSVWQNLHTTEDFGSR